MAKMQINTRHDKNVEELHWELKQWKSHFQFLDDELAFITPLLDSYVFQPNTPNLFERLQNYKVRIKNLEIAKREFRTKISKHENALGGMLECTDGTCDLSFCRKHDALQAKVDSFFKDFKKLKSEIFNYAGGILKKRNP